MEVLKKPLPVKRRKDVLATLPENSKQRTKKFKTEYIVLGLGSITRVYRTLPHTKKIANSKNCARV